MTADVEDMQLSDDEAIEELHRLVAATQGELPEDDEEQFYGLVAPEQVIIIRAYSDDADDQLLAEVKPRFIIMFEPNQEFIRRVEVYRSLSPGLAVRVYFMLYQKSAEEVKYLTSLRKEKDAFERLIKERGVRQDPSLLFVPTLTQTAYCSPCYCP